MELRVRATNAISNVRCQSFVYVAKHADLCEARTILWRKDKRHTYLWVWKVTLTEAEGRWCNKRSMGHKSGGSYFWKKFRNEPRPHIRRSRHQLIFLCPGMSVSLVCPSSKRFTTVRKESFKMVFARHMCYVC